MTKIDALKNVLDNVKIMDNETREALLKMLESLKREQETHKTYANKRKAERAAERTEFENGVLAVVAKYMSAEETEARTVKEIFADAVEVHDKVTINKLQAILLKRKDIVVAVDNGRNPKTYFLVRGE